MRTIKLGPSQLKVSRIALGCMRLSDSTAEAVATLRAALDQGINLFDHADVYGRGRREEVFSAIWREVPALRGRLVLQSKCGIRLAGDPDGSAPQRYDFSQEHIVRSVDCSLARLKTDYLDVLLLHRPDPLVEPEEVAGAFDRLHQVGKVRFFGVSNHSAAQIQLLQRWVRQPLVVNQVELNIDHTHLISSGIAFNQDEPRDPLRGDGTLEYCRLHAITLQAWSPLAGGTLAGAPQSRPDTRLETTTALVAKLAKEKCVDKEAIVIAWLLKHPARIQPIIGTTNPARIAAACQADNVELTREEWYRLFEAGRGQRVP